jgi:SAM-dependent methyltransferase
LGSNLPPSALKGFGDAKVTQIDLKPLEHVDVVADAEALSASFAAASFDYVVSTSMLEHTPRPWKVVEEVAKVLKPGGLLFVAAPWIFPLHGEPQDYWRFSMPGLRRLVTDAGLIEVESGSDVSPHGALYTLLTAYLSEALSFDSSVAYYGLEYFGAWAFAPVGLLERWFHLGSRRQYYTDSILYIVARKPHL